MLESLGSTNTQVAVVGGGVVAFGVVLNVLGYIFIYGSSPGKEKGLDEFIHTTCTPGKGLLPTVLTMGYVRAAWRRWRTGWSNYVVGTHNVAKLSSKAPDAKLVSLQGKQLNLVSDFVLKAGKGVPLIINLGSYT